MKLDNRPTPTRIELAGDSNRLGNPAKEGAFSQASADDELADSIGDVNQVVNNFDFWRFFQKDRRIQSPTKHRPTPSIQRYRRIEGELANVSRSLTPASKTGRNALGFQSVPMWDASILPTVVGLPTLVAA